MGKAPGVVGVTVYVAWNGVFDCRVAAFMAAVQSAAEARADAGAANATTPAMSAGAATRIVIHDRRARERSIRMVILLVGSRAEQLVAKIPDPILEHVIG